MDFFLSYNRDPILEHNSPDTVGRLCLVEEARANPVFGGLPVGIVAVVDTADGVVPPNRRTRNTMHFTNCILALDRRCRCTPMDARSDDGVRSDDNMDDDDGYDSDSSLKTLGYEEQQQKHFQEPGSGGGGRDPHMVTPQK